MGRSKLTKEDKDEIRKLSKDGWNQASLAAKYDVSQMTIHRVLNPEYYARTLAQSAEYQRVNADKIRKRRSDTRRDYLLSLNQEKDAAIIERLDKEENVTEYIRSLVTTDMERKK